MITHIHSPHRPKGLLQYHQHCWLLFW